MVDIDTKGTTCPSIWCKGLRGRRTSTHPEHGLKTGHFKFVYTIHYSSRLILLSIFRKDHCLSITSNNERVHNLPESFIFLLISLLYVSNHYSLSWMVHVLTFLLPFSTTVVSGLYISSTVDPPRTLVSLSRELDNDLGDFLPPWWCLVTTLVLLLRGSSKTLVLVLDSRLRL